MVHRNTLKFIGMDSKQKYLMWHESKGCFSALHRETGTISTWSIPTGKLLKIQESKVDVRKFRDFQIFEKDADDSTFKEGDYNYENHSTQLLMESDAAFRRRTNPNKEITFD